MRAGEPAGSSYVTVKVAANERITTMRSLPISSEDPKSASCRIFSDIHSTNVSLVISDLAAYPLLLSFVYGLSQA